MSATTRTYNVTGMTCEHCVLSVREEIEEISAVSAVDVDLETGTVAVTAPETVTTEQIRAAVEEAGYQLAGGPA